MIRFSQLTKAAKIAGAQRIITFGRHDDAEFRLLKHTNMTSAWVFALKLTARK